MTVRIKGSPMLKEVNIFHSGTETKIHIEVMTERSLDRQMECLISAAGKTHAIMDTGNYFSECEQNLGKIGGKDD